MAKKAVSRIYVALMLLFLYTPIAVMILMGFNESRYNTLPFVFSTEWYEAMAGNTKLIDAAVNSINLGLITAVICVILATSLLLGSTAVRKRMRALINSVVILPLTIPWLIMGLSLLLMMRALGLDRNMVFVIIGHVVISLPYAVLVISARMADMNPSLEEASGSLGANALTTFRRVTLPIILPGILAGGFLAFMISFDNFVISYFLIPTGTTTLPMEIYSSIKFGFTPEINAISTVIIGISLICILIVGLIMGPSIRKLFKSR